MDAIAGDTSVQPPLKIDIDSPMDTESQNFTQETINENSETLKCELTDQSNPEERSSVCQDESVADNNDNEPKQDVFKGILKHQHIYGLDKKKVDFDLDIELIPYNSKDFTADIQIVKELPKKIVSYKELFKKMAEEERLKAAEDKNDEEDEEPAEANPFIKLIIKEPPIHHSTKDSVTALKELQAATAQNEKNANSPNICQKECYQNRDESIDNNSQGKRIEKMKFNVIPVDEYLEYQTNTNQKQEIKEANEIRKENNHCRIITDKTNDGNSNRISQPEAELSVSIPEIPITSTEENTERALPRVISPPDKQPASHSSSTERFATHEVKDFTPSPMQPDKTKEILADSSLFDSGRDNCCLGDPTSDCVNCDSNVSMSHSNSISEGISDAIFVHACDCKTSIDDGSSGLAVAEASKCSDNVTNSKQTQQLETLGYFTACRGDDAEKSLVSSHSDLVKNEISESNFKTSQNNSVDLSLEPNQRIDEKETNNESREIEKMLPESRSVIDPIKKDCPEAADTIISPDHLSQEQVASGSHLEDVESRASLSEQKNISSKADICFTNGPIPEKHHRATLESIKEEKNVCLSIDNLEAASSGKECGMDKPRCIEGANSKNVAAVNINETEHSTESISISDNSRNSVITAVDSNLESNISKQLLMSIKNANQPAYTSSNEDKKAEQKASTASESLRPIDEGSKDITICEEKTNATREIAVQTDFDTNDLTSSCAKSNSLDSVSSSQSNQSIERIENQTDKLNQTTENVSNSNRDLSCEIIAEYSAEKPTSDSPARNFKDFTQSTNSDCSSLARRFEMDGVSLRMQANNSCLINEVRNGDP